MKTSSIFVSFLKFCLILCGIPILLWVIIAILLITCYYPVELRRIPGPDQMTAILRYRPAINRNLIFAPISIIAYTYVYVDIERNGNPIGRVEIAPCGDVAEDHDDSLIEWKGNTLYVTDEQSGIVDQWSANDAGKEEVTRTK